MQTIIPSYNKMILCHLRVTAVPCVHVLAHVLEHPSRDGKADKTFYIKIILFCCFSKRYHVQKPPPYYIQPMPKLRFDINEINKEHLKKMSLSASSLPPVPLFPTEDKSNKIPAITDGAYNFHNSQDNMHDDMFNFYDDDKVPELRHHSLEYLDDFYPIEDEHLLDDPFDDVTDAGAPQMTATTTITSLKCQTNEQQTQALTSYQTHNRASSL